MTSGFPALQTSRLDLVEITADHRKDIFKLFADVEVTRFYNVVPLKEEKEAQRYIDWFASRFSDGLGVRWGIALKGQRRIIGTLGFNHYIKDHRGNIGYDLMKEHWNGGYISEALRTIIEYGFHVLEINRLEAEVMQSNTASERVLEKLGFVREGVLRQWMLWNNRYYDMTMFSLLRSDWKREDVTKD